MGKLSNLPFLRALLGAGDDDLSPVSLSIAEPADLPQATQLLLADSSGHVDADAANEMIRLAQSFSQPAGGVWIARQSGKMISAILPVVSPGRTMLLFAPASLKGQPAASATHDLLDAVCRHGAARQIQLAQALIDPHQSTLIDLFISGGFARLAKLVYLQASAPRKAPELNLPANWHLLAYSPQTHARFARTIGATYRDSLDCPQLSGTRDMEDVIIGHKATGEFAPSRWYLLCDGEDDIGVLLLSRIPRTDSLELVYIGIVPQHRGKGAGDLLLRQALRGVVEAGHSRLSLAVDAGNTPAMQLYWRHGLQTIASKVAMLRNLKPSIDSDPLV